MVNPEECADCGYLEGEHAEDCPLDTGMSREKYALIKRCADSPVWAAEEILRLRAAHNTEVMQPSSPPQKVVAGA